MKLMGVQLNLQPQLWSRSSSRMLSLPAQLRPHNRPSWICTSFDMERANLAPWNSRVETYLLILVLMESKQNIAIFSETVTSRPGEYEVKGRSIDPVSSDNNRIDS